MFLFESLSCPPSSLQCGGFDIRSSLQTGDICLSYISQVDLKMVGVPNWLLNEIRREHLNKLSRLKEILIQKVAVKQ